MIDTYVQITQNPLFKDNKEIAKIMRDFASDLLESTKEALITSETEEQLLDSQLHLLLSFCGSIAFQSGRAVNKATKRLPVDAFLTHFWERHGKFSME
jgi:hypothetical protein